MNQTLRNWQIYLDVAGVQHPHELPNQPNWRPVSVPGVWQEDYPDHDGVAWYRTHITLDEQDLTQHLSLRFGAVHYLCVVYCNEKAIGQHEGGYTPFSIGLNAVARAGVNEVLVRVLCPPRDREVEGMRVGSPLFQSNIPTWKAGWYYPFGGLWQEVLLCKKPLVHASDLFIRPRIDPQSITATFHLENFSTSGQETTVVWKVLPWSRDEASVAAQVLAHGELSSHTLPQSRTELRIEAQLPQAKLWDVDSPNLYVLELAIRSGQGEEVLRERFGLRSFTTDGKYFFLNGRRIYLRGTLHQGVFPKRIAAPHDEAMARQDLELLKQANCNFVRLHIKPAPVCTLDLADELGLLCMEEPPVGWITYDEQVVNRAIHNVREMIRRDRNHPSLVLWCLFNELCDTVFAREHTPQEIIRPCAQVAREMDDTRLLIDTSGGRDNLPGHPPQNGIYQPGSVTPQPIADMHVYHRLPLKPESCQALEHLGAGRDGLLFTSEFGTSGFPDMDDLLAAYTKEEQAKNLREYRQMRNYRDELVKGYEAIQLQGQFGSLKNFYHAIQTDHVEATDEMMRNIRSNSRNAGMVITQHADAASEFGGIVDLWRRPKRVYPVFAACCADRLLSVLIDTPGVYAGDCARIRVVFSDLTPKPVQVRGRLQILVNGGIILERTFSAEGDLAVSCIDDRFSLPYAGSYTVRAEAEANGEQYIHQAQVYAAAKPASRIAGPVAVYEIGEGDASLRESLQAIGYETRRLYNQFNDLTIPVIARMRGRDELIRNTEMQRVLRQHVMEGGQVLLIDSELGNLPYFFGHAIREMYGVGSYAGNCGFSLAPSRYAYAGENGHLGRPYAIGYPRIHARMEDVVGAGYRPLSMHVVPYQFGHPDDINWGCSSFEGTYGAGNFIVSQFHACELLAQNPLLTDDLVTMIESLRVVNQ